MNWLTRWYDRRREWAQVLLLDRMSDGKPHGVWELSRWEPRIRSGLVYPALWRLEEQGLVEGVWEENPGDRPARKLYRRI